MVKLLYQKKSIEKTHSEDRKRDTPRPQKTKKILTMADKPFTPKDK